MTEKKDNQETYSLLLTENWENKIDSKLNIKRSEENGFEVSNLDFYLTMDKETLKSKAKIGVQEWTVKYEIPTDFNEIEINLMETMNLPNVSPSQLEILTNKKVIWWLAVWLIWIASISAYSQYMMMTQFGSMVQPYDSDINNEMRVEDFMEWMEGIDDLEEFNLDEIDLDWLNMGEIDTDEINLDGIDLDGMDTESLDFWE